MRRLFCGVYFPEKVLTFSGVRAKLIKLLRGCYALVAQLDRVTGYEPVGRGFESLRAHQQKGTPRVSFCLTAGAGQACSRYGPVAQLGERCVRIAEVEGSIPFGSTRWTLDEHLLF